MTDEEIALRALKIIAAGRQDNGRPLAAEVARQYARKTLTELGVTWSQPREVIHGAA